MTQKPDLKEIHRGWRDHAAWCEQCLTIPTRQGPIVTLSPWPAHRRLAEAIRKQRAQGRPGRIVYLKPRRVSVSVGCCAEIFQAVPFLSGQHAFIVSYQKESAEEIFSYITHFQNCYRPYLGLIGLPRLKRKPRQDDQTSESRRRIDWENGSYIKVATAKNVKTGRSFDVRHVLLDEFAFYDNAGALMTSLLPSVPDDPDTTIIVPSTANGVGGSFHELCQKARDPGQDSGWIFLFFGWWEHPPYTRPLEMPAAEFQSSLSRNHPVYGDELEERGKYNLNLEQLNWRRYTIINTCGSNLDKFRQEYPGNPEEAFLLTGRPRFSHRALSSMPVIRQAITGELTRETVGTRDRVVFQASDEGRGALTIYRMPDPRGEYAIGSDPSEGRDVRSGEPGNQDPDYSVASVFDVNTHEQVAKFRARVQPAAFGEYLYALGWFYNWAYQVPEAKGAGLGTIEKLLELGYPLERMHRRRADADVAGSTLLQDYGWETTSVNRPQLISALDDALRERGIIIRDPNTIQECRTFVIGPSGKAEGASECHDDEVMAVALAVIGIRFYPRRSRVTPPAARPVALRYGRRRLRDEED
jgi:hypothetical protein